ncbi:MAG: PD-(D/E)XK nuclease family protein, partial [bacterium]|nr:PD-(D/E)XK nuclease family protein [bacterium]
MSIEVICTPYGPPATERLGEQIAAFKQGDPLAPVTVVVPTNVAKLGTRRALGAKVPGIAAVDFLKLFDLAERLAGQQMAMEFERKPLSGPVLSATVRSVLNTDPGLFQASARHPATEQALVRSYRDLRELSDEQLETLASLSRRAADVVRICRQVGESLKPKWYDGHDLNELAINA